MNFADCITRHARDRGDHPAVEDGPRVLTFAALDAEVNAMAGAVLAAGVRPGDLVAVMLPDLADHLIVLLALARTGAVVLSLSETLLQEEQAIAVEGLPVTRVICRPAAAPVADLPRLFLHDLCEGNSSTMAQTGGSIAAAPGDLQPLFCTQSSGTTGKPKSFLYSHAQFVDWIDRYNRNGGTVPSDRYLNIIHMSFSYGRALSMAALHKGATVLVGRSDDPAQRVETIQQRRVTVLSVTPVHLHDFLDADGAVPLFPGLRALFVATAPSGQDLKRRARERLTPNVIDCYGSNELGHVLFAGPEDQDAYPGTLGRVIDGVEGQVVDDEDRPVPPDTVGHLRFRGALLSGSYINDPEESRRAFRGDWFYPGDLGAMNRDGFVFLKGRSGDVISNQGAKFAPGEVEAALKTHPVVEDVAVFGWPHARFGEAAVAAVKTTGPFEARDLIAHCRSRLSGYKVPMNYMPVTEIPRNAMGKVSRPALKKIFVKRTGGGPLKD